jgi:hypothetical protein
MATKAPRVLLIAENPKGASFLVTRLKKWDCELHFASTCKEASQVITQQRFDLVLSQLRLRDGSAYPLTALLTGSNTRLYYSQPVEEGCWWLPALENGQSCWGTRAMAPNEFIGFLDDIVKGMKSDGAARPEADTPAEIKAPGEGVE